MGNLACLEGLSKGGGVIPKTPQKGFKVCICGGAGHTGQPLALLMAMNPRVWELSVYDLTIATIPAEGIAADLGHIERHCKVKGYSLDGMQMPVDYLEECLTGCALVIMPAGVPPAGRQREELLTLNAKMARNIVEACAKFCPDAVLGLLVHPLNAVVPAMARLYERAGLDPMKVCGITTLDVVRANKFAHEATEAPIENMNVPVVGGYSGIMEPHTTAVPLFSQDRACAHISPKRREELVKRVQGAAEEVYHAKQGKGNAMLAQAYACHRFGQAVLDGLAGVRSDETCYVKVPPGVKIPHQLTYFSSQVTFGLQGVEKVHHFSDLGLPIDEQDNLEEAAKLLKDDIKAGLCLADCMADILPQKIESLPQTAQSLPPTDTHQSPASSSSLVEQQKSPTPTT